MTSYAYDTASHMISTNGPGGTSDDASFTLDALGRFATRSVAGSLDSTYGYVGDGETVVALVGATTRVSAIGPDGSRVATKDGSTTAYLLPDLHGNVIGAEASGSTTIVNAIRYDGYGQTLGTPFTATGNVAMDVKYQGRLDVSASGEPLYDMSARFYSPAQGVFTQLDSVMGGAQDPLSMNRFLYAEANPATFVDPTGHSMTRCEGSCMTDTKENVTKAKTEAQKAYTRLTSRTTPVTHQTDRDSGSIGPAPDVHLPQVQSVISTAQLDLTPHMGGICSGAGVDIPLVFSGQACVMVDFDDLLSGKGALVTTESPLSQGSTGIGGSVTAGLQFSNARTFDDLNGPFANVGVSGGPSQSLVVGAADLSVGQARDGYVVYTSSLAGGRGFKFAPEYALPGELHGGATFSQVHDVDLGSIPIPGNPWFTGRLVSSLWDFLT